MKTSSQSLVFFGSPFTIPHSQSGKKPWSHRFHDLEAASPETKTEHEGILLAVWRTPVPQFFVTFVTREWTLKKMSI